MRWSTGQKVLLLLVLAANVLLWAIPSDVVELIAGDRQTLLGRYSREHFCWIVGVLIVSLIGLYVALARRAETRKKRAFRVTAAGLAVLPTTCAADLVARRLVPTYYVRQTLAYHRPPNFSVSNVATDLPEAFRTYPVLPPGFGSFHCTLHADRRGFRNRTAAEHCDVVALGDSFTEGSRVSDEQPWPVRFAEISGLSVYNLGMSGYAPQHYLAALKEVGIALRPRWVICTLYEENDFRSAKVTEKPPRLFDKFFKQSPLLYLLDGFFMRNLGPVNAHGTVPGIETLSWLPLAVPAGPQARYYTFAPNLVLDLYVTQDGLKHSQRWEAITYNLKRMENLCREAGAGFILAYIPSKAHVILPLVRERLDAAKVRAFVSLRAKQELPEPRRFLDELFARLDTKESTLAEWCRGQGIAFVSLTAPLRHAAADARQVYLTYNDHWTPVGHEVAAAAIYDFWKTRTE
jgi:hypothetical protein